MTKRFIRVGLGGTFDHFHLGHQKFIQFAANLGSELMIGVTHQSLTKHKPYSGSIQPFYLRKNSVVKFCKEHNLKATIVEITDIYGPTIDKESKISKLCVTQDTIAGAQEINKLRQTMNMRPLPTFICPLTLAEDKQPISSTRIRSGQIDREGQVYAQLLSTTKKMSTQQKQFFGRLHGDLVESVKRNPEIKIVVGDTSIQRFIDNNWQFDLGIYDQIEKRQPSSKSFYKHVRPNVTVQNLAGTISTDLVSAIQLAIKNNWQFIEVNGEEDLAVVAAVILAPLNTHIYYGQPDKGLVELVVTEQIKQSFAKML